MDRVCAIVVAAGRGRRMGTDINKQFLHIKDRPILYYTLKAFEDSNLVDNIVLVTAENEIDYCKTEIVDKYSLKKVKNIVKGGAERRNSVYNGLTASAGNDIVLIHDGARPFIDHKILEDGVRFAKEFGACSCGVVPKDTIKVKASDGFSESTLERNNLFAVQTPQCFKYDLILNCHEKADKSEINFTDDTSVVEYYGHKVYLYEGSYSNIKITTPEDLPVAEKILEKFTF
jgi:2-C-methyl-D-erythritol 4-phosphate cytidylyltransferase